MANTIYKRKLSGSTDGRGVKVVATASAGTTIHTAVAGTTAGTFDEVWIWAYNSHTSAVLLTIQFGGTTSPDDDIKVTIPSQAGLMMVLPGLILQNGDIVKAYAGTANVVILFGYVNTMTDA
jgi:hypothetical protein